MIYLNLKAGGQIALSADKIFLMVDLTEALVACDKRSANILGWDRDITVGGARINGNHEVKESVAQIRALIAQQAAK